MNKVVVVSTLLALTLFGTMRAGVREAHDSELVIVSASYGLADRRIDVTTAVRSLVSHGVILLQAPWEVGRKDPTPKQVKEVRIVYRFEDVESTATFNQDQDIILPPKPKGLVIVRASFGAGNRRVDVTEALRSRASGAKLAIPAGWFLGEVDPAFRTPKDVAKSPTCRMASR